MFQGLCLGMLPQPRTCMFWEASPMWMSNPKLRNPNTSISESTMTSTKTKFFRIKKEQTQLYATRPLDFTVNSWFFFHGFTTSSTTTSGLTGPRRLSATHLFQFHFSSQIFPGWQCSQPDLPFKARVGRWSITGEMLMVEVYCTLHVMLYGCRCIANVKRLSVLSCVYALDILALESLGFVVLFHFFPLCFVRSSISTPVVCQPLFPVRVAAFFDVGPLQIPCQLGLKLKINRFQSMGCNQ